MSKNNQLDNPVIQLFDELHDSYDLWGSAFGFTFALCDYAHINGYDIPDELEYSPSLAGADTDAYEFNEIVGWLIDFDEQERKSYTESALKYFDELLESLEKKGHIY